METEVQVFWGREMLKHGASDYFQESPKSELFSGYPEAYSKGAKCEYSSVGIYLLLDVGSHWGKIVN